MSTAIIFGVTGQDGSYLSEYLLDLGYEVVGVCRRSSIDNTGRLNLIKDNPRLHLIEGDVADQASVLNVIRHATIIFQQSPREIYNLAAQSHVGTSFEQPIYTWRTDAEGVLNILTTMMLEGLSSARFLQCSTSEMFGSNYSRRVLSDGSIDNYQDEHTQFAPQSPYAIAKVAAHYAVRLYRQMGVYACAAMMFNNESPRRGDNFVTRKITKYVSWLQHTLNQMEPTKQQHSLLTGDGVAHLKLGNMYAFRDWGYAGDYVRAMHLMLQQEAPDDFVIATGKTHSVREFCEEAFGYFGLDWSKFVDVSADCMRPADVEYLKGDSSKARQILGWEPQVTFKELVHMMVDADYGLCGD